MSWTVSTVMTRDVVTVSADAGYKEMTGLLHDRHISALPVIDAGGVVVGIVSEADLLLKEERPEGHLLDARAEAARAAARTAVALMTSPVVTVGPEATLTEAARVMHRRRVKRLPVVDPTGVLLGIVSRADLLAPFLRSDESIAREVREEVLLAIDPVQMEIGVEDGVVRLEGQLETRSLARIAARLVGAVEGVVGVDDQLTWRLDDSNLQPELHPLAGRLPVIERE
jgi:CBS domain-containing protein